MRVDRFRDALLHTSKKGSEDYEIDYLALGKRSQKVFIRIYLKSKEVVEKGYKPWFFKVWLFNGLINRYDLYCYEYAFLKHSWKALDYGACSITRNLVDRNTMLRNAAGFWQMKRIYLQTICTNLLIFLLRL